MSDIAQIIYLNGPSSSGKSMLSSALQHSLNEPFLRIGIDAIISWMPEKLNDWEGGHAPLGFSWKKEIDATGVECQELQLGAFARKMERSFHEVSILLAKLEHFLIIDDVSIGKEKVDQWRKELKSFSVLWVGVKAPLETLEEREKLRNDRMIGSARSQFHKVHKDIVYDLEVDTSKETVVSIVEKIISKARSIKK